MAGNLKGLSGIKGLVLRHGEKVVIAVVGCLAAWLAVKSFSLPRLEDKYQAGKLHEAITQTATARKNATWPAEDGDLANEVHHAERVDAKADMPVDPKSYQPPVSSGLDAPIVAATTPREDPKLLNAVEVRATGGSGLLAFLDEEIRKKQALLAAAEAEAFAKKQADQAAKDAQNNAVGGVGEGGRRPRSPGIGAEGMMGNVAYDPKHPKRRPIEGMTRPVGIQLQGGERIEDAYWAAVVAKVPIREQLKLYQDAFEKAKMGFDPMRDFPQYIGFLVQRAEVLPGKEIQDADWKPVPVYDGQRKSIAANQSLHPSAMATSVMEKLYVAASSFWAGMSPDVIDPRYIDYVLTSPLPPLVGRDWGPEASHPDFPALADTPPLEEMMPTTPATTTPEKPAATDLNSTFSAAAPGTVPAGPGVVPGMGPGPGGRIGEYGGGRYGAGPGPGPGAYGPGMGMGGRYSSEEGYGAGRGPGGYGPGGGYGGGEGMRSYGGAMPTAATQRTSLPKGVDFLLLRFFDYTVEPGKKYRYRVALVLNDPNSMMPESVLAPAVLDRQRKDSLAAKAQNKPRPQFRRVEGWSDPSPVVGIPLAGGARLAEVKAASEEKAGDEPVAKLLVDAFDKDAEGNAIQTALERDLRRGDMANFTSDAEYVVATPPSIDTHPGFKFATGITLVDVAGGKKLGGKDLASPGRVLLMGPAGDLFIRNELDDKPATEYHKSLFFKSKNPGGALGPEGPGPGFGGPGRRGRGG